MALSVYVHIPYCLQRCRYCDFTTFEWAEILAPEIYVQQLLKEVRNRHSLWKAREIQTLYFGGGTPSLIAPELIVAICHELANVGFHLRDDCEITIEINPATLDPGKLETYLAAGINRFSVGAQTFSDRLLQACGRRHSAEDTRETLRLLRRHNLSYSFDLLFALPGQSLEDLRVDLEEVLEFQPPHLSAYCLTLPEGHPMSRGRPPEGEQIDMFALIEDKLKGIGLDKYEISNFARSGFESRHNYVYWRDQSYWGIGLSSHSYQREFGSWGLRFWNPKSLAAYGKQVEFGEAADFPDLLPTDQYEVLKDFEALTDFAHIFLRTTQGLSYDSVRCKFPDALADSLQERLSELTREKLLHWDGTFWRLTPAGQLISNKVFEELTFLATDVAPFALT
jgi:oxygen-independent coproporphyrinogen-3 oxidase